PASFESDNQNADVIWQPTGWARKTDKGEVFRSCTEFLLPDGAALSPDSGWISNQRLATVPEQDLQRFLRLVPEFVVEVMSPSDRLPAAKRKMEEGMANGVELGWL